jgi:RNA-directed DNA polymerase
VSVHGFARHRSIRTNAKRHIGCKFLLNFDLQDFFPSINFGRVKGLFSSKPYALPEPVSLALAQICCYLRTLPAGAPTSPVVANMICARMDARLKELARKQGCTFTRYADDISFSYKRRKLPPAIADFDLETKQWHIGDELNKIVVDNGFKINPAKTRIRTAGKRLEVTGVTINQKLNVSRKLIRQVRSMFMLGRNMDWSLRARSFWQNTITSSAVSRPRISSGWSGARLILSALSGDAMMNWS